MDLQLSPASSEDIFDQATQLAADLCVSPIATIAMVGAERPWFKSSIGIDGSIAADRYTAFFSETCRSDALLEIPDALQDPRFAGDPLVTDGQKVRFYAGAPIVMPQGARVGTLCVIDRVPRRLSDAQRTTLVGLSRMVATALLERERYLGKIDELARAGTNFRTGVEAQFDLDVHPSRAPAFSGDATERVATAAMLQESRHLLQLVLDSLPARISYWDASSRNQFANKAFLAGFDVTQEAIAGRHARDVLGVDWYDRIQAPIERGLAGKAGRVEVSFAAAGAARRDVEMHFTPDLREGVVRGLFVFALDVTARREAERGLADRERRFKLLIDGVRDYAIYMLDAQGRVATWNAGAESIKGYRAADVIGQHFRMFFSPEDIAAGAPEHELATATIEGRFETEAWRMRADGRKFWSGIWLSAIRGERGELLGYANIARDLTEQVRQKVLLERAVELAPCAMLMVDARGVIVMVNAQTESTFGYARADLLGQPLEKLIPARWRSQHPGQREGFLRHAMVRAMGEGRELRALRSDGTEFPVEIGLSPIESDDGISTLAAVFDITERRRQQALIEQALAEKETLLKEVYHRVKNNLQVVQSLLSLQSQTLPEGAARAAIDDSAQRVHAMALVHEKLYQSGSLSAISLRVYVKDLMDQIAEALGTDRRKIKLHAEVADLQTGLDNAVPLGLLLTELITNCLKHAFEGRQGGEIHVSLSRHVDGDLLTVSDNGVGLPENFEVAAHSTSMGLQLAHGLARQLGGELRARSDSGTVMSAHLSRL